MNKRLQIQIPPGMAALLIVVVLIVVQWSWWHGLVHHTTSKPGGGPSGGPMSLVKQLDILGRTDVTVVTFSGDTEPGDTDGPGHAARFDRPTGLALDNQGNLYVADTGNHRIRKITPNGITTTLAGGEMGYVDGTALQARFNAPCGVCAAPDGSLYVTDTGNNRLRRIQNGQVTTVEMRSLTGSPWQQNLLSGIALISGPTPYLLVADATDRRVLKIRLDGTVESKQEVAGPPTSVVGTPNNAVAIPQSATLMLGTQTLRDVLLVGGDAVPEVKVRPALHHPVALWPLGDNWLVADYDYGAVFLVRNGMAEMLAGHYNSGGNMRGARDGDGSRAMFNTVCGIVSDGGKYVYVADTGGNSIRRIDLSKFRGR